MSALHVTNGDCAGDKLKKFVAGAVVNACDVLYDGPAPPVDGAAWAEARTGASECPSPRADAVRRDIEHVDRLLTGAAHDEVVLWFESDLFDQLNLIRTLALLQKSGVERPIWLVSPRGRAFVGLGSLSVAELRDLMPSRVRVTAAHYAAARRAWNAFRAPTPAALVAVAATPDPAGDAALPFLREALGRFLEEYPWTTNGLARSEHSAFRVLATDGPLTGRELFPRATADETRPFMGDASLFEALLRHARAAVPLISIEADDGGSDGMALFDRTLGLTDAGRAVAERRADAVALNGIDLWRGGVHLRGEHESPWRWDPLRRTLVSQ